MTQQGDVLLFQTIDDGDMLVENGIAQMSGGLETTVYLSMFGGNEDDPGQSDTTETWWGNLDEIDPARQYRSATQNLLQALPATARNLRRVEDAAESDLAWMVTEGAASAVKTEATIPALNRVQIDVNIVAIGGEETFTYIENWKSAT